MKNFVIKQDILTDIKVAEEHSYKIDLASAKQKLMDLEDEKTNHEAVQPFCQYATDACEYYLRLTEKWGRYFTNMTHFLNDISANEKIILRQYKDLNLAEKKKSSFGAFQSSSIEFLRTLESKEKSHQSF